MNLSISLLAGVIDADYRGNVGVVLFNFGDSDFTSKIDFFFSTIRMIFFSIFLSVKKGDRIAQLICEKIEMANLVEEKVCFASCAFYNEFLCIVFCRV